MTRGHAISRSRHSHRLLQCHRIAAANHFQDLIASGMLRSEALRVNGFSHELQPDLLELLTTKNFRLAFR